MKFNRRILTLLGSVGVSTCSIGICLRVSSFDAACVNVVCEHEICSCVIVFLEVSFRCKGSE